MRILVNRLTKPLPICVSIWACLAFLVTHWPVPISDYIIDVRAGGTNSDWNIKLKHLITVFQFYKFLSKIICSPSTTITCMWHINHFSPSIYNPKSLSKDMIPNDQCYLQLYLGRYVNTIRWSITTFDGFLRRFL